MADNGIKNIAIITNGAGWVLNKNKNYGGGNVVAYYTYNILKQRGYHITIICHGEETYTDYTEEQLTIKYIDAPLNTEEFANAAFSEAKKCDKIISFSTSDITDGVLIQSHSYLYRATRPNKCFALIKKILYWKKIKIQERRYKKDLKYAFAVSNNIKKDYKKHFGIKNIKVVYPACEQVCTEFQPSKHDILTFGFVYNSSVNKSGHYCILALGIAKLLGLKFNLKIILQKSKKTFLLRALIKLLNLGKNTDILPKQDIMKNFYESIDCVLMPSIHEAFGLVPLEALSYGKTCLVSDNIGFAEIIDVNSGFTFNRACMMSFIKGLFKVAKLFYKDKASFNEICKNGYNISKNYTWDNFVNKLLEN